MADDKLIMDKLERFEKRFDRIEQAIESIAVQTERINNISGQVNALWSKYDEAFGPGGIISAVKVHQASCPRIDLEKNSDRQWAVIALLATTVVGIALKVFGVIP